MAEAQGRITACRQGRQVVFRVEGRGTAQHVPALRRYADSALAAGASVLHLDLRSCNYMDSTFLGTLLYLKRRCSGSEERQFALVDPAPPCQRLLEQMGAERLFPQLSTPPDGAERCWVDLPSEPDRDDLFDFKRNVVEAHQELAHTAGPLGRRFRGLADALARELDAEKGSHHDTRTGSRQSPARRNEPGQQQ